MDDYETLLNRAREKLPEVVESADRFEIPKVRGHIQGNKTVISNFAQIAQTVRRDPQHLLKFILKELATPGDLKKAGLLLGTKISASRVNEKIEQYVRDYVLCPECKKPDTTLIREDKFTFIKCQVCGAKHTIKARL